MSPSPDGQNLRRSCGFGANLRREDDNPKVQKTCEHQNM
jgi:hypothetical protein